MQLRLVGDETAKARRSVVLVGQGEVTEPRRPVVVEVPVDPKLVASRRLSFGSLGHEEPTFVVALMVRRIAAKPRMMLAAMPDPKASRNRYESSPVPGWRG